MMSKPLALSHGDDADIDDVAGMTFVFARANIS